MARFAVASLVGYLRGMAYLAPLLTVVLFICGVVVWRLQLVAKRRFEVAEQTLTAFYRASDGVSRLRSPMLWAGELASVEIPKDVDKKDEKRVRDYGVYAARAEAAAPAFAELRTAQILAEIHLGRSAAQAIDVLFRSRQEVFAAVEALYRAGLDGPVAAEHEDFQKSMRRLVTEHRHADRTPAGDDKLSNRIDVARAGVESACRPFLDDPPWLRKLSSLLARR
jgi:hypothetical protein